MLLFAILWTVCTPRLCHGGDNDRGLEVDRFTGPIANLRTPLTLDVLTSEDCRLDITIDKRENDGMGSMDAHYGDSMDDAEMTIMDTEIITKVFTPKSGHAIKKVISGTSLIWQSDGTDECTLTEFYSIKTHMLVLLQVESLLKLDFRFYERNGSTADWKEAGINEFFQKLRDMRNGVQTTRRPLGRLRTRDSPREQCDQLEHDVMNAHHNGQDAQDDHTDHHNDHYGRGNQDTLRDTASRPFSRVWRPPRRSPLRPADSPWPPTKPPRRPSLAFTAQNDGMDVHNGPTRGRSDGQNGSVRNAHNGSVRNGHNGHNDGSMDDHSTGTTSVPTQKTFTADNSAHSDVHNGHNEHRSDHSSTINVSSPDPSTCHSFSYTADDVPMRMITVKDSSRVTSVVNDKTIIWEAPDGQRMIYGMFLLKDGIPELATIASTLSDSEMAYEYLFNNGGKWEHCTGTYAERLNRLKVLTNNKVNFAIRLWDRKDTDYCTVFEATMLGKTSRFYFPKPGYRATEIKDGRGMSVWRTESPDERCISCSLYLNIELHVAIVTYRRGENVYPQYFERIGRRWKALEQKEFYRKMNRVKVRTVTEA